MRGKRWLPLSLLLVAGLSCHRARKQLTAAPTPPQQAQATLSAEKTSSSKAADGFDYYDKSEFKSGGVSASVDPGGYSAAKEVDSYSLMLDYAGAEGAAPAGAAPETIPPPTAEEVSRWTESQFLTQGSGRLLNHDVAVSVDIFQAGVARFPDSVKLHTGLGIALTARGDYESAIASLLRATDLAPSDPRPYYVLAKAYTGAPHPNDEVAKRLDRLVSFDPRNPQALYYDALALEKGNGANQPVLAQARSLLERSVAFDPNFAEAHLQLGIVYAAQSRDADAIREYQAAVKLKPSLPAAHYRLAQAYAHVGQKEAAQHELDLYERLRKPSSQ